MNPLEALVPHVLTFVSVVLALSLFITFLRAIIGPRMSDRIVSVNMVGTQAIMLIACLTVKLGEGWLIDIGIVYAMFSFLAVVVLSKMDIGAYREWRADQRKAAEHDKTVKEALAREAKSRRRSK